MSRIKPREVTRYRKMSRLGPKMYEAVQWLHAHPHASQFELCKAIGPNGSNTYGYWILLRCANEDKFGPGSRPQLISRRTRTQSEMTQDGKTHRAGTVALALTNEGYAVAGMSWEEAAAYFRVLPS